MSTDKYRRIFLGQMKAVVFIILQIFFATRADLKIGEYHSDIPQFLLGRVFSRVTRLDQSRASENTWWITNISYNMLNSILSV